jgi:hypothetical protein
MATHASMNLELADGVAEITLIGRARAMRWGRISGVICRWS